MKNLPKTQNLDLKTSLSGLKKHQARKRFGQNFLHDTSVIAQIVDAIGLNWQDWLLEIGPGMGALTDPLLRQVQSMTVIELDKDLASTLRMRIGAYSHPDFNIIEANALTVDYRQIYHTLCQKHQPNPPKKLRIVGNLPYNISTPLLFHLLEYADIIEDMHFMLQKEVVDRITATVGTKAYGRLSVMMQYFCRPTYLLTVPNGAFSPPPKVTSAVFRLQPYQTPLDNASSQTQNSQIDPSLIKPHLAHNEKQFALVVREAFNHRRKTLRAIFRQSAILPEISDTSFAQIGIDPQARPETLDVAQFVALSNAILMDSHQ